MIWSMSGDMVARHVVEQQTRWYEDFGGCEMAPLNVPHRGWGVEFKGFETPATFV